MMRDVGEWARDKPAPCGASRTWIRWGIRWPLAAYKGSCGAPNPEVKCTANRMLGGVPCTLGYPAVVRWWLGIDDWQPE